jgi:hypothetical protein
MPLSGMTSEGKGFDMLPDIAEELNDPNVHLIWVGARVDDGMVVTPNNVVSAPGQRQKFTWQESEKKIIIIILAWDMIFTYLVSRSVSIGDDRSRVVRYANCIFSVRRCL